MAFFVGMLLFFLMLSKLYAMPTDKEPVREVNIGDVSIDTLDTLNFNLNCMDSHGDSDKDKTGVAVDKIGTRKNQSLSNNNDDTRLLAAQTMQLLRQFMASTNTKFEHLMERENKTQDMITASGHVSDEVIKRLNLVLQHLNQSRLEEKTLDAFNSVKAVIENSAREDNKSPDILTVEKFNVTMTYLLERIEKETLTDDSTHLSQHVMLLLRHFNASTTSQFERLHKLENERNATSRDHREDVMEVLSLVLHRLNQSRQEHIILEEIHKILELIENRLIVGNDTDAGDEGEQETPTDCEEAYNRGHLQTGVYAIKPRNAASETRIRCQMSASKWTILMRRYIGAVDFNRTWRDYKHGFGYPMGEYWAGNEFMHLLTNQRRYKLRIDLIKWGTSQTYYAEFSHFRVGPEADNFRLHISGYSGTAPEGGMHYHNNKSFSTKDHRNVSAPVKYSGGWWFGEGGYNHYLNGPYNNICHDQCSYCNGIGALGAMSMKVAIN